MTDQDNGSKAGSPGRPAAASSPPARRVAAKSRPRKAAARSRPRKAAVKSSPRKAAAKSRPTKGTTLSRTQKAAGSPTPATKVVVPAWGPVVPDNGPAAGGTTVEIHGRNLVAVRSVTFDGNRALDFKEINAGLLDATSPPGTAGQTVDIVVETRIPPSLTLPGAFTYT
jgi:IPT/TIG domain